MLVLDTDHLVEFDEASDAGARLKERLKAADDWRIGGRRPVQQLAHGQRVSDAAFVPELVAGEWLDVRIGKRRREVGRQVG